MELSRKEYLSYIRNIEELEQVVLRYKNATKPVLICIANKKLQNVLISDLKNIYEKSYVKEELRFVVVKSKSEYFCRARYKDCEISKVVSSQCRYCKEKDSCRYMLDKKVIKERKHKYEIINNHQLINKILGNSQFYKDYTKVAFYKSSYENLLVTISKSEIDLLIQEVKPKKQNTNEKIKIIKNCNKCDKLSHLFFSSLDSERRSARYRGMLINELEKLEPYENYKVGYILNKLKLFNFGRALRVRKDKSITFKIIIE